jgi:hypothetical protein
MTELAGFVATGWFGDNRFGFNCGVAPTETGLLVTALAGFFATVGFVATAWFGINRIGFNIGVAPVETGWLGFRTGIFTGAGLAATIAGGVAPGAG